MELRLVNELNMEPTMSDPVPKKEIQYAVPAMPSALQADIGGPLANDDHAISSVGRIIPREHSGFTGKPVDRDPHLARLDNLTTLHCRMAIREKLGNSARAAEAIGESAALILLDLDDFDDVNDTYGQAVGDACLQGVANRLIAAVGAVGFLARMEGDEFAVLLQGHTRRSLSHILKRIQEALALPFSFDGYTLHLTSSIGIAVRCDRRGFSPDELKGRAPPSQGWRTFLRNHAPDIAAMDLFVVPTIGFDLLYALVIVRLDRRDLVWINVTANPTAEWVARQITEVSLG